MIVLCHEAKKEQIKEAMRAGNLIHVGGDPDDPLLSAKDKSHGEIDTSLVKSRLRLFNMRDALSNVSGNAVADEIVPVGMSNIGQTR